MSRLVLIFVAAVAFGQEPPPFVRTSEYVWPPHYKFPGADWEKVSTPEAAGFSSKKLAALRAWLETQDTTGMLVVTGGRVLFQYGDVAQVSKIASVRKSVLGMLMGKYVATGKLRLHATVKEMKLDDLEEFRPIEQHATLQDLLMSRSGIYLGVDGVAPRKGSVPPGAMFHYNNWDFNAAGTAFEKLTGVGIYEALGKDLAEPIGMQDYDPAKQKKIPVVAQKLVSLHPEYAMYLSTRDMARLGLLMARQGKWKDTQVLPKNWTEYLTTLVSPSGELWPLELRKAFSYGPSRWGYGVMWWVWDAPVGTTSANWGPFTGSYTASGTDGQFITVVPAFDLVVAHKNANIDQTPSGEVSMFEYQTVLQMLVAARCEGECKQ